jgi:predicted nucleic acid-binding protein
VGGIDSDVAHSGEWVIDTTVLSAFALGENLDVLGAHCGGRASWTTAVYSEVFNGLSDEPRLGSALVVEWLNEPEPVFQVERVEDLRLRLGGGPRDDKHLGEATSIVLAQRSDAGILVDDRDAKRLAETLGVRTGTTVSVLKKAVRREQMTAAQAASMLDELTSRYGRRLPQLPEDAFQG